MQVVSAYTSRVSIITMYDAVKVIRRLGQKELAEELDSMRLATQPPPLRHNTAVVMRVQHPAAVQHAVRPASTVMQPTGRQSAVPAYASARLSAVPAHASPPPAPPPPAPPPPPQYIFPSSLDEVFLTPAQQTERYLLAGPLPGLLVEIGTYQQWCQAPINTERSARYIRAAQSTSLEQVPKMILGFLGSTSAYYDIRPAAITLDMYKDPQYIAHFIG